MDDEQKELYREYIIRHFLPKFDGRKCSDIIAFLDLAKELAIELSFVSSQSREFEPIHFIK